MRRLKLHGDQRLLTSSPTSMKDYPMILATRIFSLAALVPLAFALSEGSEQRAPMGQAVIGGVITSSLLTLVVVPVIYVYLDDVAAWTRRRFGAPGARQSAA